jgi:polygalacturonase
MRNLSSSSSLRRIGKVSPRTLGAALACTAALALGLAAPAAPASATSGTSAAHAAAKAAPHAALPVFNVKNYGASGNGTHNDTSAINKAIVAANAASGGGIVEVPSGTYLSANSIHMLSNVTIQLDSGSTIVGSSAKTYDAAESNPNDKYQDYGHSHFHDAMIWGDRLTNIGFTGSGTIDGGGHLITGNPGSGQADKIISLTRCDGLTLSGITLKRGGHFGALTNGCTNVVSDHLTIATAGNRDGWNVISTTNVTITNIKIAANDDALVFKSDWALGQTLPSGHVSVNGATLSAQCCNALMFGSETCGPFTDYTFDNITITGAGKSGLGMVSMDGANISDVHYSNITMSGVSSPIMEKIGNRLRCGGKPTAGHISNVTFTNVTGTGAKSPQYSPTLWGLDSSHRITDVTFNGVNLTVPGGSGTVNTGVPSNNGDYNPNSIGTRPAYGWYLHYVDGIQFTDSSVRFNADDARPAVIANSSGTVSFNNFTAQRGSKSPYDIGFQTVSGYCVANSQTTTGGKVKVNSTGSTSTC